MALPASVKVDDHQALASLEIALLPIAQFSGEVGAPYRNPRDPDLRLDFVTSKHRGAASLASYYLDENPREFAGAWRDAIARGAGWRARAKQGRAALVASTPGLDDASLWK